MPINRSESTYILDVDFKDLKGEKKKEAQRLIGELLVDKINKKLDISTSSVKGGSFKKRLKSGKASKLFEDGDMRSQITFEEHSRGVKVGIFKDAAEIERLKAQNHNLGVTLPTRQFIPRPSEEFKGDILRSVNSIVNRIKDKEPKKKLTAGDIFGEDEN